jgi:hypothetical protein
VSGESEMSKETDMLISLALFVVLLALSIYLISKGDRNGHVTLMIALVNLKLDAYRLAG